MSKSKHEELILIAKRMHEDYKPWGNQEREEGDYFGPDCSWGCKFFNPIEGQLGADWGVCSNPKSHRAGLLTFEHQGCKKFEADEDERDT